MRDLRCEVCRNNHHSKWHEIARGGINPVALVEFLEGQQKYAPAVVGAIIGYVCAVTGMDIEAMHAALQAERA